MNILDKIALSKIKYLELQKKDIPLENVKKAAKERTETPSFKRALEKPGLSIIAEIKKASPSKGIIDPEFDFLKIAGEYNLCADAVSVLTEEDFFMGKPEYITEVRKEVDIPILRKDFIIDSYQIFESRVLGASAVLLITALLDSVKLKSFIELTDALGMDSLVEVHNETELYRALRAGAEIIGINNRNLEDFTVDIRNTAKLSALVPANLLCISESGIKTKEDVTFVKEAGADAILVGESFMVCGDKAGLAEVYRNA